MVVAVDTGKNRHHQAGDNQLQAEQQLAGRPPDKQQWVQDDQRPDRRKLSKQRWRYAGGSVQAVEGAGHRRNDEATDETRSIVTVESHQQRLLVVRGARCCSTIQRQAGHGGQMGGVSLWRRRSQCLDGPTRRRRWLLACMQPATGC